MGKYKQRGALLLEFVMILPFFLWLTFAALYYAMVAHDVSALHDAVRAGCRYGAVKLADAAADAETQTTNKNTALNTIKNYADDMLYLYTVADTNQITVDTTNVQVDGEDGVKVTAYAELRDPSGVPVLVSAVVPENISSTLTMRLEK